MDVAHPTKVRGAFGLPPHFFHRKASPSPVHFGIFSGGRSLFTNPRSNDSAFRPTHRLGIWYFLGRSFSLDVPAPRFDDFSTSLLLPRFQNRPPLKSFGFAPPPASPARCTAEIYRFLVARPVTHVSPHHRFSLVLWRPCRIKRGGGGFPLIFFSCNTVFCCVCRGPPIHREQTFLRDYPAEDSPWLWPPVFLVLIFFVIPPSDPCAPVAYTLELR